MCVCKQMLGATLREAFDAWRGYIALQRDKKGLALKAVMAWAGGRQRQAFNALRWYALRRQMGKALVAKHRLVVKQRCLAAWRAHAGYQRELRIKWTTRLAKTNMQVRTYTCMYLHACIRFSAHAQMYGTERVRILRD